MDFPFENMVEVRMNEILSLEYNTTNVVVCTHLVKDVHFGFDDGSPFIFVVHN